MNDAAMHCPVPSDGPAVPAAPDGSAVQPPGTDFYLDLRGESCPYPVIHTLEALAELGRGQRIEIVSDCPQAYRNIPDEATNVGSRMLCAPVREGAQMSFFIEKGEQFNTRRAVKAAKAANKTRTA